MYAMHVFPYPHEQYITYKYQYQVPHNDLRDITAELLSKVCNDVAIGPSLQSLSGEVITP